MQVRAEPNSTDGSHTALCRACENQRYELVSILLEHGARASDIAPSGTTALHCAARAGPKRLVTHLIEAKADPLRAHTAEGTLPVEMVIGVWASARAKRRRCTRCCAARPLARPSARGF